MTKRGGWPATGFGRQLQTARESKRFSQVQLAERAGCHPFTISKLERGEQEPAWPLALALAQALGVSVAAFADPATLPPPTVPPPPRGRPRTAVEQGLQIGIDIAALGAALKAGEEDKCLNLRTGEIVAAQDRPEAETGTDASDLAQGKPYIRIPNWRKLRKDLRKDKPLSEEIYQGIKRSRRARRALTAFGGETSPHLTASCACWWIARLQPPIKVVWLNAGENTRMFYDPATRKWHF
jgi:transcriptional regulator with XRE-family HTH domain